MPRIIKSDAFADGYASYSPLDADENWILNHPSLSSWLSGSGISMRSVDNLWDDIAKPTLNYYPAGTLETGARPSTALNGRPGIEMRGGSTGHLKSNATIPESYTLFAAFLMTGVLPGQTIIGDPDGVVPRAYFGINTASRLTLTHASGAGSQANSPGTVSAGVLNIGWARFDAEEQAAHIALNSRAPQGTGVFDTERGVRGAGAGFGAFGNGANPMTGHLGDAIIFSAALSDAEAARVVSYLARRYDVMVA